MALRKPSGHHAGNVGSKFTSRNVKSAVVCSTPPISINPPTHSTAWLGVVDNAEARLLMPRNNKSVKQCSKCKRELEETNFVKSARYLDGLYPSCKECRKKVLMDCLAKDPMCAKCKTKPHQPKHRYCYDCQRDAKGYTKPARWRRDSTNDYWCCRCKDAPRAPYHRYCYRCKNASTREWSARKRAKTLKPAITRKERVRRYIYTLYQAGKISREPCYLCGEPSVHFHHLDYEERTTNIIHLCRPCHVIVERNKRHLTKVYDSLRDSLSA